MLRNIFSQRKHMSQMFHVPDQLSFNKLSGKGVTKLGQKLCSYVTCVQCTACIRNFKSIARVNRISQAMFLVPASPTLIANYFMPIYEEDIESHRSFNEINYTMSCSF